MNFHALTSSNPNQDLEPRLIFSQKTLNRTDSVSEPSANDNLPLASSSPLPTPSVSPPPIGDRQLPPDWHQATSPEGLVYFYNEKTAGMLSQCAIALGLQQKLYQEPCWSPAGGRNGTY